MTAIAADSPLRPAGGLAAQRRRRERNRAFAIGAAIVVIALVAVLFLRDERVIERRSDSKTVQVVLPPPLVPPPPPEPQPVEEIPEPRPMPLDQPIEEMLTPPEPAADPVAGDSALTAREGPGPSNYGLARGDGSGRTIGGRPGGGGNGFAAYGERVRQMMQQALQGERSFATGRYTVQLALSVGPNGQIAGLRMLRGSGDAERDAAILSFLRGRQLPAPPAGLPAVRLEFNSRPAA